jgi:ATP-dependent Clp protease adaptor protein ClpS
MIQGPLNAFPREGDQFQEDNEIVTIKKSSTKLPSKYNVFLHNDDYTTMEFVVLVLQKYFHKSLQEAEVIMLKIHHEGKAICGTYGRETAETKVQQVINFAKENGFPLKCTMGPEK